MKILIKLQRLHPDAKLPRRWSLDAVGYDLHAYLKTEYGAPSKRVIGPNSTVNIPTGLLIEIPPTHFGFILPRRGLGKHSISVTNSPGLIDPDYRNEIQILVYNGSYVNHWVQHEDRIAQLLILPITHIQIVEASSLSPSPRGQSGFGSTSS